MRICAMVLLFAVLLTACGRSDMTTPSMPPEKRDMISAYFKNNPYDVPKGWSRGVLIASVNQVEDTIGETFTWKATVVTPAGETKNIYSQEKEGKVIFELVPVGADFLWHGEHPTWEEDIKILKNAAVG